MSAAGRRSEDSARAPAAGGPPARPPARHACHACPAVGKAPRSAPKPTTARCCSHPTLLQVLGTSWPACAQSLGPVRCFGVLECSIPNILPAATLCPCNWQNDRPDADSFKKGLQTIFGGRPKDQNYWLSSSVLFRGYGRFRGHDPHPPSPTMLYIFSLYTWVFPKMGDANQEVPSL